MWVFIRVIALIIGCLIRLFRHRRPLTLNYPLVNPVSAFNTRTNKQGLVTWMSLTIPCKTSILFKLTPESSVDRFCKQLGIAQEFQSQDALFDQAVYIACDHYLFCQQLLQSPQLREHILSLVKDGYQTLEGDGLSLRLTSTTLTAPSEEHLELVSSIARQIVELSQKGRTLFSDPFAVRVIFLETILYGLFGYTLSALLTAMFFRHEDIYLDFIPLVLFGSLFGLGLLMLFLLISMALLGRSSRAHRIFAEVGLIMLLSAPVLGTQIVSEINQNFDTHPTQVVVKTVTAKNIVVHRGRRGSKSYTYKLSLAYAGSPSATKWRIPTTLRVNPGTYRSLLTGDRIRIHIGQGRLGFPWYRGIEKAA